MRRPTRSRSLCPIALYPHPLRCLPQHYPEMLKPTRVRKERAGNRISGFDKFKASKPRGKMSQDGKGGRSANS